MMSVVSQVRTVWSVVSALHEIVAGIEPVVVIGTQRFALPFLANVEVAAVDKSQTEADMIGFRADRRSTVVIKRLQMA